MACTALFYSADDRETALADAARLGLAARLLAEKHPEAKGLPAGDCVLWLRNGRYFLAAGRGSQLIVSDLDPTARADFRKRYAVPTAEALTRAVGKRKAGSAPHVLDACAGTGADGLLLRAAGFRVTSCERHPIAAFLLARRGGSNAPALFAGAAETYLADNPAPDVVYLDPMFRKKGSALAHKDMFLLQCLAEEGNPEFPPPEKLLYAALAGGAKRVVVKRHAKAPALGGFLPSFRIEGKAVRYDVYQK